MLIDTHAHINFNAYKDDADEAIKRALDQDVWLINVGSQLETSQRSVDYAQKYSEGVYTAVGLHPIHLEEREIDDEESGGVKFKTRKEEFDFEKYWELAQKPKVVAIGEVGLDYKLSNVIASEQSERGNPVENHGIAEPVPSEARNPAQLSSTTGLLQGFALRNDKTAAPRNDNKEKQKEVFVQQLELAQQLNLPVILHCREAYTDLLQILKDFQSGCAGCNFGCPAAGGGGGGLRGVVHCFCGDLKTAQQFLEMDLYLGFNGLITFSEQYDQLIKEIPLEKILLETDCPYLSPVPFRGQRNEPAYVKYVAQKITEIKGIGPDEVAEQTTKNARELFGI